MQENTIEKLYELQGQLVALEQEEKELIEQENGLIKEEAIIE